MKSFKYLIFFLILWLSSTQKLNAQVFTNTDSIKIGQNSKFPNPQGSVNDFENILTGGEIKKLSKIINRYEKKTSNQICIVTVESIKPYENMADYTADLANYWGVGQKNKNNGLAIVVSKHLRETRIGTGLGAERFLTDTFCKAVIDNEMIPEFKKGKYFNGLKKGIKELINE